METQRHNGTAAGPSNGTVARPVGDLLKDLLHESQALVRGEVALLRTELSEKVNEAQRGATSMLTGAAVLYSGVLVLLAAVVLALGEVMDLWAAALIVGSAVAGIGAGLVFGGKKKLEAENLKPHRVIAEAKADQRFVKERVS